VLIRSSSFSLTCVLEFTMTEDRSFSMGRKPASFILRQTKLKPMLSCPCTRQEGMWEVEIWPHAFFTSAAHRSLWPASGLCHFTPRGKARSTHGIGVSVGL
jgi:hypothetical protein